MFFGGFPGGFPRVGKSTEFYTNKPSPTEPVENKKLYNTLGVPANASESELKRAYRKLAIQHHPDKGGDPEIFKEVTHAYEILSNAEKRKIYDQYGEAGLDGSGPGSDPSDFFEMFFGGGSRAYKQGPRRTQDISVNIKVTLEQLYTGCTRKLGITRDRLCVSCNGEGGRGGAKKRECITCKGRGVVVHMTRLGNMITQQQGPCNSCRGEGRFLPVDELCQECRGSGSSKEKKVLLAEVRPGAKHGSKIVFEGESDHRPNLEAGSVIVHIEQEDHSTFKRVGDNLVVERSITLLEALTGFSLSVTHLDGRKLVLHSPPGARIVKPGTLLQVSGEGMPVEGNRAKRGNLVVKLDVIFPTAPLSPDSLSKLTKILSPSTHDASPGPLHQGGAVTNGALPLDWEEQVGSGRMELHYLDVVTDPDAFFSSSKSSSNFSRGGNGCDDDEASDENENNNRGGGGVECRQA